MNEIRKVNEIKRGKRVDWIDQIKGIAIIFVIIVHVVPRSTLHDIYSRFYFNQAVPIFMLFSGYLLYESWEKYSPQKFLSAVRLRSLVKRIVVPFVLILLIEFLYLFFLSKIEFTELITNFVLQGGWGPGSYYPWIYLQSVLFFPLILIIIRSQKMYSGLIWAFLISITFEVICVFSGMPTWVYRMTFFRYFFALYIGALWKKDEIPKGIIFYFLVSIGFLYLFLDRNYDGFLKPLIYPLSWEGSHAPAYFYSFFFASKLIVIVSFLPKLAKKMLTTLGIASYHVFLCQMLYFALFNHLFIHLMDKYDARVSLLGSTLIAVLASSFSGILFFKINKHFEVWLSSKMQVGKIS